MVSQSQNSIFKVMFPNQSERMTENRCCSLWIGYNQSKDRILLKANQSTEIQIQKISTRQLVTQGVNWSHFQIRLSLTMATVCACACTQTTNAPSDMRVSNETVSSGAKSTNICCCFPLSRGWEGCVRAEGLYFGASCRIENSLFSRSQVIY